MYPPPQRMQSLYYMLNQLYTLCMQSCMYPPPQRMQSLYYMLTYDTNTYVCTLVCIYLYYIICSHMTQIHKCVHLCVYTCVCISDEGFINAWQCVSIARSIWKSRLLSFTSLFYSIPWSLVPIARSLWSLFYQVSFTRSLLQGLFYSIPWSLVPWSLVPIARSLWSLFY